MKSKSAFQQIHRISLQKYRELPIQHRNDGGTFWYYVSIPRRQFRKETGQPVVEYFNAIRLEKAKELLVSTNMDIADIVSRIGYVDVSSFIRKFKARFGVTPGKFRELHQNKSCTCC